VARDKQRAEMGRLMDLLVRRKRKVHYAQVRPMVTRLIHTVRQLRAALRRRAGLTMDCSESVTLVCRLSGLRDPNGLNYDGEGFTGTLLGNANLEHYSDPHRARTGALWVVGAGTGEHVCMVRHPGDDPVLFSHGTEADPTYYPLSVMIAAFPGQPWTFLSIANL
jgi:hypothetical protein